MMFAGIAFWRGDDPKALKLCEEVEEETRGKPERNADQPRRGADPDGRAAGDGRRADRRRARPPPRRGAEARLRRPGRRALRAGVAGDLLGVRLERALDDAARGTPIERRRAASGSPRPRPLRVDPPRRQGRPGRGRARRHSISRCSSCRRSGSRRPTRRSRSWSGRSTSPGHARRRWATTGSIAARSRSSGPISTWGGRTSSAP